MICTQQDSQVVLKGSIYAPDLPRTNSTPAVSIFTGETGNVALLGLPALLGEVLCSSVQHACVNVTGQLWRAGRKRLDCAAV